MYQQLPTSRKLQCSHRTLYYSWLVLEPNVLNSGSPLHLGLVLDVFIAESGVPLLQAGHTEQEIHA
jgi:hypothetical protein